MKKRNFLNHVYLSNHTPHLGGRLTFSETWLTSSLGGRTALPPGCSSDCDLEGHRKALGDMMGWICVHLRIKGIKK
jgi:hypothetical protein